MAKSRSGPGSSVRRLVIEAALTVWGFPAGLFVLTMAGSWIRALTRFHCDELYPRFGLPRSLPEPAGAG